MTTVDEVERILSDKVDFQELQSKNPRMELHYRRSDEPPENGSTKYDIIGVNTGKERVIGEVTDGEVEFYDQFSEYVEE